MTPGKVFRLFKKYKLGYPITRKNRMEVLAHCGIRDDVSCDTNSPRQVLITDWETIKEENLNLTDLRQNIILKGVNVHALYSGSIIHIGQSATFRLMFHCEVCQKLKNLVGGNLSSQLIKRRGYLAVVITSGWVSEGDEVRMDEMFFPYISDDLLYRIAWALGSIPRSKVVTYADLVKISGAPKQTARVLPALLSRLESVETGSRLPIHRVIKSDGKIPGHILGQDNMLQLEGIVVIDNMIDLNLYRWNMSPILYSL